jgi:hypothetical protein
MTPDLTLKCSAAGLGPTSEMGQSRHFDRAPLTSGLPRSTDIVSTGRHVSKVPTGDIARTLLWTTFRVKTYHSRGQTEHDFSTNNYAPDSIFTKTSPAMISGSPRLRSCMLA